MTIAAPTARAKEIVKSLENPDNWKLPLLLYSTTDSRIAEEVEYAINFYHGGSEIFIDPRGKTFIGSRGYYHYIGA